MSDKDRWQSGVSFSTRLGNVQKMSVTGLNARNVEEEIFNKATSLAQYQHDCDQFSASQQHQQTEISRERPSPGEPLTSSAKAQLGPYKHAQYHNDGIFSTVFKARSLDDTEWVALKQTTPSMILPPHNPEREARILAGLSHDNIIPLLGKFHMSGGKFVLVFPFLSHNLGELLEQRQVTSIQAKSHLRDLFTGLDFLHSQNIIHRDIKPSNMLLKTPDGPACLTDFGIAWSPHDAQSEEADSKSTDIGTTCYRPPETLFGSKTYGCSLDMWAAGCVVAELSRLSPQTLFDAGDLGSELALIHSIFRTLGTPTLDTWPEAKNFQDWGKMEWKQYSQRPWDEVLPNVSPAARDLVSRLIRYQSSERLESSKVLQHAYFNP